MNGALQAARWLRVLSGVARTPSGRASGASQTVRSLYSFAMSCTTEVPPVQHVAVMLLDWAPFGGHHFHAIWRPPTICGVPQYHSGHVTNCILGS